MQRGPCRIDCIGMGGADHEAGSCQNCATEVKCNSMLLGRMTSFQDDCTRNKWLTVTKSPHQTDARQRNTNQQYCCEYTVTQGRY
jgi:hypothetical protein